MKNYQTFGSDEDSSATQEGLRFRMDFERDGGDAIVASIQQNIRTLNEQVSVLEGWLPQLSTRSTDGGRARQLFNDKAQQLQQLGKDTNRLMRQLVDQSNNDRALRVHRERLSNQFAGVLNRLQAAQRNAATKEKEDVAQMRGAALDDVDQARYQREVVDQQQQMQMRREQQINLQEIKERQTAINELERDIADVNQIFVDLARMVHEQGDMVDSIEDSVDHAVIQVQQGATNVQQAVYYNDKARKKKMMLCAFLAILIFILGLTVYFGIKR